jgi:hypothetical protein
MSSPSSPIHGDRGIRNEARRQSAGPNAEIRWAGLAGYLALLAGGVALFFLIRAFGDGLGAPTTPADTLPVGRLVPGQVDLERHVVATLAAVVFLGFVLGRAFRYLGQPPVIGEIIAGIALGPSLLGVVWPDGQHMLIPSAATDPQGQVTAAIRAISQLGVILYMFLVGLELNAARLAGRAHAAVAVSHASIIIPFVLGAALALGLYPSLSHEGVPFTVYKLRFVHGGSDGNHRLPGPRPHPHRPQIGEDRTR